MMTLAILCMTLTAVFAAGVEDAASSAFRYDPYFDPPTNIAAGKPLRHIPEHHRQHACTVDHVKYYEHGELFRINYETRCVTYRCEFGSYTIYLEGCLDANSQRCVPVGHNWTVRCHTFFCAKSEANGMLRYEAVRNNIACYDQLTNSCRRENELFSYLDNAGVLRNRCTCRIIPGASEIVCFGLHDRVNYVLPLK